MGGRASGKVGGVSMDTNFGRCSRGGFIATLGGSVGMCRINRFKIFQDKMGQIQRSEHCFPLWPSNDK